MTSNAALHDRYRSSSVETMSPGRLIVALYDRLLLDLRWGVEAMVAGDVCGSHAALMHAQDIVNELLAALDLDAWSSAPQLASLYEFVLRELVEANVEKNAARVVVCHDLLVPLREAWFEAAGLAPSTP